MIEGPKDAKFLAYRRATEEESESHYGEPMECDQDEFGDLSDDDTHVDVGGESEDKDEGG